MQHMRFILFIILQKKLEAWKPSVFMLLCFFCISVFNAKTLDLMWLRKCDGMHRGGWSYKTKI